MPDLDAVFDMDVGETKTGGDNAGDLFDATIYGGRHRRKEGNSTAPTVAFALPSSNQPSKRPAAVSAVVPTFATFDDTTPARTASNSGGAMRASRGLPPNGRLNGRETTALRRPIISPEARQTMKAAILAEAAHRAAERQHNETTHGTRKESSNTQKKDAIARLKENQYWV